MSACLRPSSSATPSIDYPSGGRDDPRDETDGISFVCVECEYEFFIDPCDYRGQFDHPPAEPVCHECRERLELEGA